MKSLFPNPASIQGQLAEEEGTDTRSIVSRKRYFNFPEVDNVTYGPALFAKEMTEHADIAVYPNDPNAPLPNSGYDIITGLEHSSDSRAYNPPMRDRAGFNGYHGNGISGDVPLSGQMVEDADASGRIGKHSIQSLAIDQAETYSFEDQTNQFSRSRKPKKAVQDPMHMNETELDDGRNMAVNYSPSFYDHSEYGTYVKDTARLQMEQVGTPIEDIESGTTSKVEQFNQLPLFDNIGFMNNRFTQSMNNDLAERGRLSQVGTNTKRPMGSDWNQGSNYSLIEQTNQNSLRQKNLPGPTAAALHMNEVQFDDGRNMAVNYSPSFYNHSEYGTYVKDTPRLQIEELGTPISQIEQQTTSKVQQFNQLPLFDNRGFMNNRFTQAMNTFLSEEDRLSQIGTQYQRPLGLTPETFTSIASQASPFVAPAATKTAPAPAPLKEYPSVGHIIVDYPKNARDVYALIESKTAEYNAKLNQLQPGVNQGAVKQAAAIAAKAASLQLSYTPGKKPLKGNDTVALSKDAVIKCIKETLTLMDTSKRMIAATIKPLQQGEYSDGKLFNADGTIRSEISSTKQNLAKLALAMKVINDLHAKINAAISSCDAKIYAYEHPASAPSTTYKPAPAKKQIQKAQLPIKAIPGAQKPGAANQQRLDAAKQASNVFQQSTRASVKESIKASDKKQSSVSSNMLQVKGEELMKAYDGLLARSEKLGKSFDAIKQGNLTALIGNAAASLSLAQKTSLNDFANSSQPSLSRAIRLIREVKGLVPKKGAESTIISIPRALIAELDDNQKTIAQIYSSLSSLIKSMQASLAQGGSTATSSGGSTTTSSGGSTATSSDGGSITSPGGSTATSSDGGSITSPGGSTATSSDGGSVTSPGGSTATSSDGSSIAPPAASIPVPAMIEVIGTGGGNTGSQVDQLSSIAAGLIQGIGNGSYDFGSSYPYLRRLAIYLSNDVANGLLTEGIANAILQAQFIPLTEAELAEASAKRLENDRLMQERGISKRYFKRMSQWNYLGATYKLNPRYAEIAKQGDLLSAEDYEQVKNDVLASLPEQTAASASVSPIDSSGSVVIMTGGTSAASKEEGHGLLWLLGGLTIGGAAYVGYKKHKKNKNA